MIFVIFSDSLNLIIMMMDPFPPTVEKALDAVDKEKELTSLPASVYDVDDDSLCFVRSKS